MASHGDDGIQDDAIRAQLHTLILELLHKRAESSTMCPSEAPRALEPTNWRPLMETTREVARQMAVDGLIEFTQRGKVVDPQGSLRGPLRLRLSRKASTVSS